MSGTGKKRVLILGAGFAGLYTALHLERALDKDAPVGITLVDRNHFHLFTLCWLLVSSAEPGG
jgi:NADH dehydrogenase